MVRAQTLRQLVIAIGLTTCSISDGFIFGQMSGMIDALSRKDTPIPSISESDLSWMASSISLLCVIGFGLMGVITELFGRRKAITIVTLPATVCWILVYFANDKTLLICTRIVLSVCFGGILVSVYINIGEYQPPEIRPLSITVIALIGSLVGLTIGHVLSILMDWRYVALFGAIPCGLSAILPLFWVESPAWLAAKGRFEECEKAFKALRIPSEKSDNELRSLLAYERKKQKDVSTGAPKSVFGRKIAMALKQTYFWKIALFSFVICSYRTATGRILFSTLAITMLQDITGSEDILFFTLLADSLTILGAMLSCYFLYKFKIRDLLFLTGFIANVFLVVFSVCLYMYPEPGYYVSWCKVFLLGVYFVLIMAGPCPILDMLVSEIFPMELKSFFVIVMGLIASVLQFLSIKLVPDLLPVMGYHGIFLINAFIICVCLIYMWFYLPETKGRSLHEIEYYFKNNTFNFNKELFMIEQTDDLLNKHV